MTYAILSDELIVIAEYWQGFNKDVVLKAILYIVAFPWRDSVLSSSLVLSDGLSWSRTRVIY